VFTDCADCIGPKLGVVQPNATVIKCAVSGSIYNETSGLIITAGAICGQGCPGTTTSTTTIVPTSTTTIAPTSSTTTIAPTSSTTTQASTTTTTTTAGPTTTSTTIIISTSTTSTTTIATTCRNCASFAARKDQVQSASGYVTFKSCVDGSFQTWFVGSQVVRNFVADSSYDPTWTGGLRVTNFGTPFYAPSVCNPTSDPCRVINFYGQGGANAFGSIQYLDADSGVYTFSTLGLSTPFSVNALSGSYTSAGVTEVASNLAYPYYGPYCTVTPTSTSTSTTTLPLFTTTTTTSGPTTSTTTIGTCDCLEYQITNPATSGNSLSYSYRQCGTGLLINTSVPAGPTTATVCAVRNSFQSYFPFGFNGACTSGCPTTTAAPNSTTTTTLGPTGFQFQKCSTGEYVFSQAYPFTFTVGNTYKPYSVASPSIFNGTDCWTCTVANVIPASGPQVINSGGTYAGCSTCNLTTTTTLP
jgi:hypothetical protein